MSPRVPLPLSSLASATGTATGRCPSPAPSSAGRSTPPPSTPPRPPCSPNSEGGPSGSSSREAEARASPRDVFAALWVGPRPLPEKGTAGAKPTGEEAFLGEAAKGNEAEAAARKAWAQIVRGVGALQEDAGCYEGWGEVGAVGAETGDRTDDDPADGGYGNSEC